MSPPAFYRLFQSVLEVHGFVALDSGDALQIVPDANARFGAGSDYVTQAIVLENIAAAQLVPILRPLLPQSAHLAAHPTSNSLIVADRPQNIQRILTLIRRMDQAGTEDVEVVTARKRRRGRGRAHAERAEPGGAGRGRPSTRPGHRRSAHEQRAAGGQRPHAACVTGR